MLRVRSKEEVPDEPETMEIGKAHIAREGTDVTLVSLWGVNAAGARGCRGVGGRP